jgi:uncharacterized surface protein with fasciclin (FAS1) repeats
LNRSLLTVLFVSTISLHSDTEDLSTLELALYTADLLEVFDTKGLDATVFAPTDGAFTALAEADETLFKALLTEPWILHLTYLLYMHVVEGTVLSTDLSDGMEVATVIGETLTVSIDDSGVCFTNAFGDFGCVAIPDV